MVATYAKTFTNPSPYLPSIRQEPNIMLICGSGFGGSEDLWPYLTGDWSEEYDVQPMPFDGFLFVSRVMVAKEAHTSSVKDLIVAAPGVADAQWEGTMTKRPVVS